MARSRSSCLKLITCGGRGGGGSGSGSGVAVDESDLEPTEGKGSLDKGRWSFRKRSTRHPVLSNTVISESPTSGKNASPTTTSVDFHSQNKPTITQKMSLSQWMEDIPTLSTPVSSEVTNRLSIKESGGNIDPLVYAGTAEKIESIATSEIALNISQNWDKPSAIVLQAAIRGYLAQRAFLKLKNVVKLQAAFRGHLERRQALGTLRCVQAIVKMQALVRARRARISLQGSASEEKIDRKHEDISRSQIALGKEQSKPKSSIHYSSTEKLLTNGFARQLLESVPKKKRIHIKCDPSKRDSAWKWLERWVSVASPDSMSPQKLGNSPGNLEGGKNIGSASGEETGFQAEVVSNAVDLKQKVTEAAPPHESEENLVTCDVDTFKFQACNPSSSSVKDVICRPQFDDVDFRTTQSASSTDATNPMETQLDATSQTLPVSIPDKPEQCSKQPRRSIKRAASEQPETEGKRLVFGSRKACNPAFAAVQSKFEELSSSAISSRSNTSQLVEIESKFDNISSTAESGTRKKEHNLQGNLTSHETRAIVGGSECGTELSISSTLDSPDRSEIGGMEFGHETEITEKITSEPHKTTDKGFILQNLGVEPNNSSDTSRSSSSHAIHQQEKLEVVKGGSVETAVLKNSPTVEQQPERSQSDMQIQMEVSTENQAYMSSGEGSPKSHTIVPELHGTPSSQVSAKAKRSKLDKIGATQSRKSLSASKRSPSNSNHDSGASNREQLVRDSENGKRRNSFGSSRSDHIDQDPRGSTSISVPSYMQATESARLKALANTSPVSSPDMQGKDVYIRKRHSLPGANGKQVSPRIQRSMSQAQQGAKGNGTHTQDRKWQR